MVLVQPYSESSDIEDVLEYKLDELVNELNKKEKLGITLDDIDWQFFSREEWLGIKSSLLYPDEDLPGKLGVYRGYSGGGMHAGLIRSEVNRMSERRQAKAERIIDIFQKYFWEILKEVDAVDEANTGETKEAWDSVTI